MRYANVYGEREEERERERERERGGEGEAHVRAYLPESIRACVSVQLWKGPQVQIAPFPLR